ncbi:hypothetical protein HMPREF0742_01511 [Rothia aeria F0184]|uniref:Uncharacterized protein n=1 Tax=Rothia aeria F0184 TaxID=888019 RepID=U7V412_9MICC|nr:hypothetical protein HMPREF0742_01511 [Rothia aeria F0184]
MTWVKGCAQRHSATFRHIPRFMLDAVCFSGKHIKSRGYNSIFRPIPPNIKTFSW